MATVYDKIWLPVKLKSRSPEQESVLKAEALNTVPEYDTTQKRQVGLFHIAGLVSEEGLKLTIEQGLTYLNRLIEELEYEIHHRPVWCIVEDFYVFGKEMTDLMLFLEEYYPGDDYKDLAIDGIKELKKLRHRVKYNELIYKALKIDNCATKAVDKFIASMFIARYEKLGFSLGSQREIHLHEYIDNLIETFKHEVASHSTIDLTKTQSSREVLRKEASCDEEKLINICSHTYSHYHSIREAGFKAFYAYDESQAETLLEIMKARHDMAKIQQYPTYAHMMAEETVLDQLANVTLFIRYLQDNIFSLAAKEYSIMGLLKENLDYKYPFAVSDVKYIIEWARDQISQEDSFGLYTYLSLGQCVDGINHIFKDMFFFHFDVNNILYDEVYSADMHKLQVIHVTFGIICYIFLDLMKRAGKPTKTTHYILREGKFEETPSYISQIKWRPIRIVLVMSIQRSGYPAELSIREAESLFMELGRMLPAILSRSQHQYILRHISCIDVPFITAHLMKELFYHPKVMGIIYKTYPDGRGLTSEQIENIICSRKIFRACEYQKLLLRAAVDQSLYGEYSPFTRLKTLLKKVDKTYYGVPMYEDCFYHLKDISLVDESTSGKNFNQLINLVVVKRLWDKFFAADPLNSEASDSFMQMMKELLHISDTKECYERLLDMEIDVIKLSKILVDDAKQCFEDTSTALQQLVEDSRPEEEDESEYDPRAPNVYAYFSQ